MKDDQELNMLLGEISTTSSSSSSNTLRFNGGVRNGLRFGVFENEPLCSPIVGGGFSLRSDGSSPSSNLFTSGYSSYEKGSLTPPLMEDFKHNPLSGLWKYSRMPNLSITGKNGNENLSDELLLSRSFSRMCTTSDEPEDSNGIWGRTNNNQSNFERFAVSSDDYKRGFSDYWGFQSADGLFSESNSSNSAASSPCSSYFMRRSPATNLATSSSWPSVTNAALLYAQQQNEMNLIQENGGFLNMHHLANPRPNLKENSVHYGYSPTMAHGKTRGIGGFITEESLIIQEGNLNYEINEGLGPSRGRSNERRSHLLGMHENAQRGLKMCCPNSVTLTSNSLAEARGFIYLMAKDQNGCRFLQRAFDEGTPQDVMMIFSEIIDHVVELMMNPFGNYLMQKLLEVCNEEQRMQILLRVTEKPGDLISISLNTHGTRVVQKMIDTLKTRQQISLVISALKPGFRPLIKDLNGNHVIQRCLLCLSKEDNEFIFVAAAKYCVDMATQQHGCCVLQKCINHSTGAHRENLVSEISANALHLAQDAFGNYVVQVIMDLRIPAAMSNLHFQFEGNYVNLSMQKFSSHVIEKFLIMAQEEIRSAIIREMISASNFDQLLQDPHGNYVVQTALRVSEVALRNTLANAIESHKAILRNSPFSKWIFSQKLLKK